LKRKPINWRWVEGDVDRTKEHFELRYGDASETEWRPVALIGPPPNHTFPVKWLTDESTPEGKESIRDARKELDFYLVEKREPDPWAYAKYHCGTASNIYSRIHWSYYGSGNRGECYKSKIIVEGNEKKIILGGR
jgi:hypothetical protein